MKFSRVIAVLMVMMLAVCLPGASFAGQEAHTEKEKAFVKLLQDSSVALQAIDPAVAHDLTVFADEESKELVGEKEGEKEVREKNEVKIAERRTAHMKTLHAAAAVLKASRPDLSAPLEARASKIEKKLAKAKTGSKK